MKLFVPKKVNVGFQNRSDTYTGKLAYVIYWDDKGVLRKEKSWQSWRDEKIEPSAYDNAPTEGFVLNKKVGGYKSDWNFRQAYVRIFDPRGFEFEITVPNLLFILAEADCSKGKGLEGKFVYAWDKTDLVLLPVSSLSYKEAVNFTKLQATSVKSKDLILGATYASKNQGNLIYVGRFDWHQTPSYYGSTKDKSSLLPKQYVFHDGTDFIKFDSMKPISAVVNSECAGNYADLVESFNASQNGSRIVDLILKDEPEPKDSYYYDNRYAEKYINAFHEYVRYTDAWQIRHYGEYHLCMTYEMVDGKFRTFPKSQSWASLKESGRKAVWAVLESGSEFKLSNGRFVEAEDGEEEY